MPLIKDKFVEIGRFSKPVGVKGEIKVDIEDDFMDDFLESDHFFVKIKGNYAPFFIEYFIESSPIVIKAEEIDNPEDAGEFRLKEVYLRERDIQSKSGSGKMKVTQIHDFILIGNGSEYGTIIAVTEYPSQFLAEIDHNGKIFMIPLVDEWITDIDEDNKKIYMNLPDGLLDL